MILASKCFQRNIANFIQILNWVILHYKITISYIKIKFKKKSGEVTGRYYFKGT